MYFKNFRFSQEDEVREMLDGSEKEKQLLEDLEFSLSLEGLIDELPNGDNFATIISERGDRLNETLLRFLRTNSHRLEKSENQFKKFISWRKRKEVGLIPLSVIRGNSAALPISLVPSLGNNRTALIFCSGRYYPKRDLVPSTHQSAVIRTFEEILFSEKGYRARNIVAVVDFEKYTLSQVDLVNLAKGVNLFFSYYPEVFEKFLFVSYPKFVPAFWKIIERWLDQRTIRRIKWCSSPSKVGKELREVFQETEIPNWLGGQRVCKLDLLTGLENEELYMSELVEKYRSIE